MKVKITKASTLQWYGGLEGEEFDVEQTPNPQNQHRLTNINTPRWVYIKTSSPVMQIEVRNYVINREDFEIMENFVLKSGMGFETANGIRGYFIEMNGELWAVYHDKDGRKTCSQPEYVKRRLNPTHPHGKYVKIFEADVNNVIDNKQGFKKVIYPAVTELTLQQVADKFNIPVNQLRIKE
jgi:hypothetical protein